MNAPRSGTGGGEIEVESFPVLVLRDGTDALEATFVPSLNMLCCSLRHHGVELLAQNAGVETYAQRGKTMGIPLLYPWANRLGGFGYEVAGRAVRVPRDPQRIALDPNGLPIHGIIGGRIRWDALPRERGSRLTARLRWGEGAAELFEVFPFRHELEYDAELGAGRLEISVAVHACAGDPVPVAFGFHPYLSPPNASRIDWLVELPEMRHLKLDDRQIPLGPDGPAQPARRLRLDDVAFDDGFDEVREPARFAVHGGAHRIALELLEGYPCAQVYAPPTRELICFEPMTAPTDALRNVRSLRVLEPGERYRARFAVRLIGEDAGD